MAHKEQIEYCKKVKNLLPNYFEGVMVLDAGSLDINGNNQYLFENSHYIGIDVGEGRNVDFAQRIHELSFPDDSFDTIISTEVFEHDMYYKKSIRNLYRMLKPGGLLLITCATTGRPEHGTKRTTPDDAPFLHDNAEWSNYYKNLTEEDIRYVIDIDESFHKYEFEVDLSHKDLNFWGLKNGIYKKRQDSSYHIESSIVNVDLDAKLSEGKKKVDALTLEIEVLNTEIKDLNAEIKDLNTEIKDLNAENNTLNSEALIKNEISIEKDNRIYQLENELSAVYFSKSWKLTKFLRKLSHIINK